MSREKVKKYAEVIKREEVRSTISAGYGGPFSIGVTIKEGRWCPLLHVPDDAFNDYKWPSKVRVDDEDIPVVVKGGLGCQEYSLES
jgi:hypothetical protein